MTDRCHICGKVRPDPPMSPTVEDMKEWEEQGEGWFVFASWDRHIRWCLCRDCGKIVKYDIDNRQFHHEYFRVKRRKD